MGFFTKNLYYDIREGLIGHWKFDEAATNSIIDSSRSLNHGSIIGGSRRGGILGGCLRFNGPTQYATIPNHSSVNAAFSQITVATWINNFVLGSYRGVVSKYVGSWLLYVSGSNLGNVDKPQFLVTTSSGVIHTDGGGHTGESMVFNRWYHIVGTYNGSQVKIYQNGRLVNSVVQTNTISLSSTPVEIGRYQSSNYFNGLIDDVRIYNRELSNQEILLLYNQGKHIA